MKILILSQYFWPEHFLINDLAEELSIKNEVTVITGRPNYPGGKIYKGFESTKIIKNNYKNKILVFRVPNRERKNSSKLNLALNYFSFIYQVFKYRKKFLKEIDFELIFFFGTSPITSVIPGIYLKIKKNVPLIIWVQDLWPGVLKSTGYIKSRIIIKIFDYLVNWIYKKSDLILTQSNSFKDEIVKSSSKEKVLYFPNCIKKTKLIIPNKKSFNEELNHLLINNFCITFAGNIGKAQDYEVLINTALDIKKYTSIKFIIIGHGANFEKFKSLSKKNNIKNIFFFNFIENKYIKYYLQNSKALLLTLKNDFVLNRTIPSKFQAYLEVSKPIIACANGEVNKLIKENNIGFASKAEDFKELTINILKLFSMKKKDLMKFEENSKNLYLKCFNLSNQTAYLEKIFTNIIDNHK